MNVVINGSRSWCFCGPAPIKSSYMEQKIPGTPSSVGLFGNLKSLCETLPINPWMGALPMQLQGRVGAPVWESFIAAVNAAIAAKPGIGCCGESLTMEMINMDDVQRFRQQFQASLGCGLMDLMRYEYTAYNNGEDGPTWIMQSISYIHLQWPLSSRPAMGMQPAPQMMMPGIQTQMQPQMMLMMPPGMVMVAAPSQAQGMVPVLAPQGGAVMYMNPVH